LNILLTGSSGFIGQYFLKNYKQKYNIKTFSLLRDNFNEHKFENIDIILHLAALVHQMNGASWEDYKKANIDYPIKLAKKAKKNGVKHFIFMSSVKVYGEKSITPFNENSKCSPEDNYGKSKLIAENELLKLNDKDFKVSIIRTPVVYGEGVKGNIINLVKLIDRLPILPFGCIYNKRNMVYIGNLCALIDKILEKNINGIFLASDENSLSTTKLTNLIISNFNKTKFNICIPFLKYLIKFLKINLYTRLYENFEIDTSITNTKLDFKPPFSVKYGISNMVKWYDSLF